MAVQIERTSAPVKRHMVSLEEYDRMIEAGVFEPDARVELIRGEIVDMPPPGPGHENAVTWLNLLFVQQAHRQAVVWPQGNTLGLPGSNSRPQPDIALLRWRDDLYRGKRPAAEDVLLLVEVSESSLKFDRGAKLALYAEAGIPEYWIVNLVDKVIEVYADPEGRDYRVSRKAQAGETLLLPGEITGTIEVADILG